MGHPKVFEAAVIGLPHPKWDERPFLIIAKKDKDTECTKEELMEYIKPKVHRTWLPDDIAFVDAIPK